MLEDQEQLLYLFSFFFDCFIEKAQTSKTKKVKVTKILPLLCVFGILGRYAKERDAVSERVCDARHPQCCLRFVCVVFVYLTGLRNLLQPCSRAARKWRENEEIKRKWRENEEIER